MRKTHKKSLSLNTQTVRTLGENALELAAGGAFNETGNCVTLYGCKFSQGCSLKCNTI